MNILVGVDSISNYENSVKIGTCFKRALSDNHVSTLPVLDGGKGTVDVMKEVIDGSYQYVNVHDPLNRAITARYARKVDFAVMEMAESSGIHLIYEDELDILDSSSLGFGEMIEDGLNKGVKHFFIGIGDTATNDMGMGMLYALGVRFYDGDGNFLEPIARNLSQVAIIDMTDFDQRVYDTDFQIATSSDNNVTQSGNVIIDRAKRKGASSEDIEKLRDGTNNFMDRAYECLGINIVDIPGLASGGGVARAMASFLRAKISRSMDIIMEFLDFESLIKDYDLLFLGEKVEDFGAISSLNIANFAKKYKPSIKIVFLKEKGKLAPKDLSSIDVVYEYQMEEPDEDRRDYRKEVRRIAREAFEEICAYS